MTAVHDDGWAQPKRNARETALQKRQWTRGRSLWLVTVAVAGERSCGERLYDSEVFGRNLTFVACDPPRSSYFAAWDPANPGGLGATSSIDIDVAVPAKRGTRVTTVAAEKVPLATAIDLVTTIRRDDDATASVRAWSAVLRSALALIAAGKVLPWVSPAGYDTWRVDPLEPGDHQMVSALVAAMPAEAHATPAAGRGAITDPTFAIRAAFDAVADTFIRTPAAHRIGSLRLFADPKPTKVPHLRPWVHDLASAHCSSCRLVLRMHPPLEDAVADTDENGPTDAAPGTTLQDAEQPWRVTFALQSRSDPSLLVDAGDYWSAPTEVIERLGHQAETTLLAGLLTVTRLVKPWADLLDDVAPTHAVLEGGDLDHFLDQLDELDAADIDVRWPSELVAPKIERRLVVSAGAPTSGRSSTLSLEALLDVDWEFLLDGTALTTRELDVLAAAKRSIVSLRGRWVRLDRATVRRLRAPTPPVSVTTVLAAALGADMGVPTEHDTDDPGAAGDHDPDETIEIRVVGELGDLVQRLFELTGERLADEPPGLHAELRSYQKRGLAWMTDLCRFGLGGCLADDMGLGKTIQVLALHVGRSVPAGDAGDDGSDFGKGPTLVVCPTSLMNNWAREAARFVPDVDVRIFHGPNRDLDELADNAIVVTSYGVVRSDAELLDTVGWGLVVADEAQHAKNPRSRTARSMRRISSGVRLALTGTPVENNLSELWSIIDWAVPGLLGPLQSFRRTIALPIERDGDQRATDRLQRLVQPFLLRRTKTDEGVAPELPAKIERDLVVPLSDEQVTLYKATTESVLAEVAGADGIDRRGLILKLLTNLKQITNHPAHFLGEPGPLDGRSGKLDALDDLLAAAEAGSESTLVFSQYVAMANLIAEHQRVRGRRIGVLHGGLSIGARQDLVDRFQSGEISVLVLSLKAGGTGLNLTAATNVVHYDRWWNPAVEDQATDRAYRIGQTKAVTVHRIITEGTVEDRVADLLSAKRKLAEAVTGAGESWIGDLDDDALAELVELSVN